MLSTEAKLFSLDLQKEPIRGLSSLDSSGCLISLDIRPEK